MGAARGLSALIGGWELTDADTQSLMRVILVCGMLLQALACLHAEFNVEQGEAGNVWEPLHYAFYGTGVQNFEWSRTYAIRSPIFVFPLMLLAVPFLFLPLSKLQLFYCIRVSAGVVGTLALHRMANASRRQFGNGAAVIGLILAIFNHGIAFSLGRLGIDSLTMVAHALLFAAWQHRNYRGAIWICAFTVQRLPPPHPPASLSSSNRPPPLQVLARPSFALVAGAVGLSALLFECSPGVTRARWAVFLVGHALFALAVTTAIVFATDSLWSARAPPGPFGASTGAGSGAGTGAGAGAQARVQSRAP
jgi:hypothetical protein